MRSGLLGGTVRLREADLSAKSIALSSPTAESGHPPPKLAQAGALGSRLGRLTTKRSLRHRYRTRSTGQPVAGERLPLHPSDVARPAASPKRAARMFDQCDPHRSVRRHRRSERQSSVTIEPRALCFAPGRRAASVRPMETVVSLPLRYGSGSSVRAPRPSASSSVRPPADRECARPPPRGLRARRPQRLQRPSRASATA